MKKIKERNKRYGWLIGLAIVNWLLIGLVIWKVDPEVMKNMIIPGSYLPMMVLVWCGLFLLISILLMSARRALVWSVVIVLFLELRVWGLGSVINGLLMLGMMLSWEMYNFSKVKNQIGTDNL